MMYITLESPCTARESHGYPWLISKGQYTVVLVVTISNVQQIF